MVCRSSDEHIAKNCQNKKNCTACSGARLTCLHRTRVEEHYEGTSNCMNVCFLLGQDGGKDHSMIIPVWVRPESDPSKGYLEYAVLDDQSNIGFVSESLCDRLNLLNSTATFIWRSAIALYISNQVSYFWSFDIQYKWKEVHFWKRVGSTVNTWGQNTTMAKMTKPRAITLPILLCDYWYVFLILTIIFTDILSWNAIVPFRNAIFPSADKWSYERPMRFSFYKGSTPESMKSVSFRVNEWPQEILLKKESKTMKKCTRGRLGEERRNCDYMLLQR